MLETITQKFRRNVAAMHCPADAVPFKIGRRTRYLSFDWQALDEIKQAQGLDDLAKLTIRPDRESLTRMLLIGLRRHHNGEFTEADIARASPPLVACIQAIEAAFNLALWGPDGPPKAIEAQADA